MDKFWKESLGTKEEFPAWESFSHAGNTDRL